MKTRITASNIGPHPGSCAHEAETVMLRKGRALMLMSVAFFIANALIVRLLGTTFGVNSWLASTARFVIGLAVVMIALLPGGRVSGRALVRNPLLIARGVIGGTGVVMYYHTVAVLGAGRATFINNTYLLWGALLATVFLREHLRPRVAFALAIGLVGVALLTGLSGETASLTLGDLIALLGAISSGIVIVLIRKLHERENTSTIFAAQCAWGLVFSIAPTATGWETPALVACVLLVLSGLLAGAGQLTMTAAYRALPVAEGSLFQMLVPLGIGLGGVMFFGERYTTLEGVGAVLIVVSCLLAARTRPRLAAGLPSDLQRTSGTPAGVDANSRKDAAR